MSEEDLFHRALALPPADRPGFLAAACGPDDDARGRVERLLAAHDDPDSFLAHPPAETPTTPHAPAAGPAEQVGGRVGPYKLLQRLGEGGMGEVWVAEQERPVRRRVALKLIKPGMDSARVLARFEAERQALAIMDHTNIAKVFDAGTTPAGRPFFAMELVKGVPVTTYCDELHLSIRDRLGLFVQVCRAVQHAHQKGVIHRDIKPSNVLVAIQDGKPVPKVIDFGVAKAVHAKLADRTMYTELGAVIGTLEYMAPEQAELSALDVDTRADVYALGALLYELLTGTTPLTKDRLKAAGLAEVLRLIREEEPPRPSTRLTQSKEAIAGLAAKRRTEPRKLGAEVRGELDWIVMRCLEKDRTRRYESAGGLAKDVERFLTDEPVEACPPSAGYRVRKFLRRNRVAVTAAAAILVAAVLAVVGQTVNLLRAEAAEALARDAEQRAVAERQAADDARRAAVSERDRARLAEAEQARERERAEAAKAQAERDRDARQTALSRSDGLRLGSEAMIARPANPGLALLLGLEAVRRYPHPLTFNALFDAAADLRERRTFVTDLYDIRFLRVSPDGGRLLAASGSSSGSKAAAVFDAATGRMLAEWHGYHNGVADLDWSPDGTRAVAALAGRSMVTFTDGRQPERATFTDRVAYVWDAATGRDVVHLRRHDDRVVSVRFSPDGRKVVTASWDETARIWDAATGKELHVLRGHQQSLLTARFSPDGRRVLTVSAQRKNTAHYRDHTGKPRPDREPNTDPGIPTRPWRPDGWSSGGMHSNFGDPERVFARLWDAETGRPAAEFVVEKGVLGLLDFTRDTPAAAEYSPAGRRVAVGFSNDLVGVWDAEAGGAPLRVFRGHRESVTAVAFSPDGKRLAAAGYKAPVIVWDLETGREVRRLAGHPDATVDSVRFSADGARVVTAAGDRTARVWDVSAGRELAAFRGHTDAVRAACFHGDADTVVTAADRSIRFWSVQPPPPVPTLLDGGRYAQVSFGGLFGVSKPGRHTASLTALAFSPDGRTVVTGSHDYTARLWDAETGRLKGALTGQLRGTVTHAAFAPDGRTVYVGTELNRSSADRGDPDTLLSMVHRWDTAAGTATRFLKGQDTGVHRMALSPDGRHLLVVSASNGLAFRPTRADPNAYGFSDRHDGGRVTVWELATGQLLARLPVERNFYNTPAPEFGPDGNTILYAQAAGLDLALFDARTGDRVRTLAAPKDGSGTQWAVARFSPDGRTVAAVRSGGRDVWFWDAATGAVLGSFRDEDRTPSWVRIVQFGPDSKRLAVTSDRDVLVIDVATRRPVAVLRGHEAKVNALAFSPDGARLATGSDDRSAAVWEAATGRLLAVYKGHPGPVHLVAYSPDGVRVATASTDPVPRVWPVDLVAEFDRRRPRDLTSQERDRYELPAR